jgi:hypothetical protein
LRAGVPLDDLRAAVGAVSTPTLGQNAMACDGPTETRQFLARTPVTRDPSQARFERGRITVAGRGVSARNPDNGRPEAWFDTDQPVEVNIEVGGAVATAQGTLPLTQTIRQADKEYRFELRPHSKRGFIEVQMTVCDLPA